MEALIFLIIHMKVLAGGCLHVNLSFNNSETSKLKHAIVLEKWRVKMLAEYPIYEDICKLLDKKILNYLFEDNFTGKPIKAYLRNQTSQRNIEERIFEPSEFNDLKDKLLVLLKNDEYFYNIEEFQILFDNQCYVVLENPRESIGCVLITFKARI